MKQNKIFGAFALALTLMVSACNGGGGKTSTSSKHTHDWGDYLVTQEATCTEKGSKKRTCKECGEEDVKTIAALGHTWGDWVDITPATCTEAGEHKHTCTVCHVEETETIEALGHDYQLAEDQTQATAPTCEKAGTQIYECSHCHDVQVRDVPALGHDLQVVGEDEPAAEGKAKVRLYTCKNGCGITYFGFKATEVTAESKEHLTFTGSGEEAGAAFWGRPIGNAVILDDTGSATEEAHEAVYDENEEGDFFEYVFDLTQEQVNSLGGKAELYCDAKPSNYMGANGIDFWKIKGSADTDWTPGFFIDGPRKGEMVDDFRYVLYVDDVVQTMDASKSSPVPNGDPRGEYILPFEFSLHAGENKIRLVMAGGYRSIFYNFTFRPIVAEEGGEGGNETHEHAWTVGDKAADSALRPMTCTCNGEGYELQAADLTEGQKAPSVSDKNTRLGKNLFDDVWSIKGIKAGKYALYMQAQASSGNATNGYWNSATAVANGDSVGNNGNSESCKEYKYKVKVDGGDYVNLGASEDNYAASGLSDKTTEWTTKALAEVTIANGAQTITIHNMNNGYSIWVFAIRLVKIA